MPSPNPPRPKVSTSSTSPVSNVAKAFQGARGSPPHRLYKRVGGMDSPDLENRSIILRLKR
ncbi:hypothetical protein DPMN_178147 [Dreissena polymorpha]|uniref:Uncharacterized protein n=1 Tax=Dreissena polymorpha TaxID=45954 RepID=A0A9D4EEF9_DREPO|nr:hypothetical protein DPMN_178147 [Dreissena polymorpha]